jgi:tetratricopeptide (TPR) repeat protein
MDPYAHQHDPNLIIHAAEERKSAGDLSAAHMLFESALLEWGDEAREGMGGEQLREALATLWLAYADFHRSNKAWKSAMDTYEQAINDPISGTVGRVFLEYARFAEERDKLVTAQKVYLRALVGDIEPAVTDEQDNTLLWNEFLEMMRKTKPGLTLASLKDVVYKERQQKRAQPEAIQSTSEPDSKRPKQDGGTKTHVVTADEVQSEQNALIELISQMPPEISAAWMARDGDAPPQAPEHPLFSPTRPKMPDASGRDLIGDEMALRVTERLLSDSGTALLETCRALWLTTALMEKEAFQALKSLDKNMVRKGGECK